nr:MAG TPA: conotoxin [Caudoviricetes sp.]
MKYFSEKLNALFNTEAELLHAEHEAENEAKADELYNNINDILGFACAYMAFAMQKARDAFDLAEKIEDTYGVKYEFNRGLIGDIAEKYIEEMCNCMEEDDAYAEQCLGAWDDAWNGNNDSCVCCGASDCDSDCPCEECEADMEHCVQNTLKVYRPFYSINIRNPIFQRFIHEYRNIAPMKKLAEEFPTIADMFDRLESGND